MTLDDSRSLDATDLLDETLVLRTGGPEEILLSRFASQTDQSLPILPAASWREVADRLLSDPRLIGVLPEDRLEALGLSGAVVLSGFSVAPSDSFTAFALTPGTSLSPDGLSGQKIAITLGDDALTEAITTQGAIAVPLPAAEVFIALLTGVVDGVASYSRTFLNTLDPSLGLSLQELQIDGTEISVGLDTTPGPDVLDFSGTSEDLTLNAQGGADHITTGSGDDSVKGGDGRDTLILGAGMDTATGGNGQDTILGQYGADRLSGRGKADNLEGGGGGDTLLGQAGADTLLGQGGKDFLIGGNGGDLLQGGNGADTLSGRSGNDTLLGQGGADQIMGNNAADDLSGGGGADTLSGNNGRDTLDGGAGNDRLSGGEGSDVFVFEATARRQIDTIIDFTPGLDALQAFSTDYTTRVNSGDLILNFGDGQRVKLEGLSNAAAIRDDISLIGARGSFVPTDPALVIDLGGKFDRSLNEAAYAGATAWAEATGNSFRELELTSEAQRAQVVERFAESGADAIVLPGFAFQAVVEEAAPTYTDTNFVLIDAVVDAPNVRSVTFDIHEGAFLMGVAAALASDSGTVGFVGGMDIPLIRAYAVGYAEGAWSVDPDAEVLVNMTGTTPLAWNDPVRGSELARAQIAQGADVIFQAAGGTGIGVMQTAADERILSIGNDANQNYLHPGTVLTSLVKGYDEVVFDAFTGGDGILPGHVTLGLAEGGMSYALDENNADLLTRQITRQLDAAAEAISSGDIVVHDYVTDPSFPELF